jgi:hypothetical protein
LIIEYAGEPLPLFQEFAFRRLFTFSLVDEMSAVDNQEDSNINLMLIPSAVQIVLHY